MTSREFVDPTRSNWAGTGSRPVRVVVWYPAAADGTPERVEHSGESFALQRDASLAPSSGARPLILISHGSGGRAQDMMWLGRFLVLRGYIVAAVNHNGTAEEELHHARPTLTDFFGWERAGDVSVALTELLKDPQWSRAIASDRIGAAGFSLGGTTALWTAGVRLDLELLRLHSPPPPAALAEAIARCVKFAESDPRGRESVERAPRSYRDPRIAAVFALAPPMGVGFPPDGLRDVAVPVCIVVGDQDRVAPAEGNARHFAQSILGAQLVVVPGERGHYLEAIPEEQRRAELGEVAEIAFAFFERQWTGR